MKVRKVRSAQRTQNLVRILLKLKKNKKNKNTSFHLLLRAQKSFQINLSFTLMRVKLVHLVKNNKVLVPVSEWNLHMIH